MSLLDKFDNIVIKKPKEQGDKPSRPSFDKSKLKDELRKLLHVIGAGHKLYTELGFKNIIEAKARAYEIIDKL